MKCTPFSRYYLYKRSVEMCRSLPFQARILCGSYVHSMMWLSCCFIKKMRETPSSSTWTAPNGTKEACLNRFTAMRCAKSLLKTFVKLCFSLGAIFDCLSIWNFLILTSIHTGFGWQKTVKIIGSSSFGSICLKNVAIFKGLPQLLTGPCKRLFL